MHTLPARPIQSPLDSQVSHDLSDCARPQPVRHCSDHGISVRAVVPPDHTESQGYQIATFLVAGRSQRVSDEETHPVEAEVWEEVVCQLTLLADVPVIDRTALALD